MCLGSFKCLTFFPDSWDYFPDLHNTIATSEQRWLFLQLQNKSTGSHRTVWKLSNKFQPQHSEYIVLAQDQMLWKVSISLVSDQTRAFLGPFRGGLWFIMWLENPIAVPPAPEHPTNTFLCSRKFGDHQNDGWKRWDQLLEKVAWVVFVPTLKFVTWSEIFQLDK